ncbi:hypothetical protein BJX96DRAFT_151416 [Aspergillus floccosus]
MRRGEVEGLLILFLVVLVLVVLVVEGDRRHVEVGHGRSLGVDGKGGPPAGARGGALLAVIVDVLRGAVVGPRLGVLGRGVVGVGGRGERRTAVVAGGPGVVHHGATHRVWGHAVEAHGPWVGVVGVGATAAGTGTGDGNVLLDDRGRIVVDRRHSRGGGLGDIVGGRIVEGTMVEALITFQAGPWVVSHLGTVPSTGWMTLRWLLLLLLLLLLMMGHRGVDDLHLVILPRGSWTALFGTIFAAGANPIQVSSLEGGSSSRRESSSSSREVVPARRWGRLGAVDGGGGATRIAGITGEVEDRVGERPEIGARASGGDFGDLTSVGDDSMGVFVVFFAKGGVRRTFFGRHDEQQKWDVGSPRGAGATWTTDSDCSAMDGGARGIRLGGLHGEKMKRRRKEDKEEKRREE